MLSNVNAIVALAASERGRAPVILPMPLSGFHGRRRGCSGWRRHNRAHDGGQCARVEAIGPGDGLFDYGGFTVDGAPITTYEARDWACPRRGAACPASGQRELAAGPTGPLHMCATSMTVRAHTRTGAGPWRRCAVSVATEVRPASTLIRHTAKDSMAANLSVACALDARVLAAARDVVSAAGGHPYTALHIRAGDLMTRAHPAHAAALGVHLHAPRVTALLQSAAGGRGPDFVAADLPARRLEALAAAVEAATGRRVLTASRVPALAALRAASNYALFVVENAIMNGADTRLTTFAQAAYAPSSPQTTLTAPPAATAAANGTADAAGAGAAAAAAAAAAFWHGAIVPQHPRRGDGMGRLCMPQAAAASKTAAAAPQANSTRVEPANSTGTETAAVAAAEDGAGAAAAGGGTRSIVTG